MVIITQEPHGQSATFFIFDPFLYYIFLLSVHDSLKSENWVKKWRRARNWPCWNAKEWMSLDFCSRSRSRRCCGGRDGRKQNYGGSDGRKKKMFKDFGFLVFSFYLLFFLVKLNLKSKRKKIFSSKFFSTFGLNQMVSNHKALGNCCTKLKQH